MPRKPHDSDPHTYMLTEHCCRICFGRVLQRTTFDKRLIHKCSNCGVTVEGEVHAICTCGMKLRNGKDAGIRCVKNDHRRPEHPSEVVALQVQPINNSPS